MVGINYCINILLPKLSSAWCFFQIKLSNWDPSGSQHGSKCCSRINHRWGPNLEKYYHKVLISCTQDRHTGCKHALAAAFLQCVVNTPVHMLFKSHLGKQVTASLHFQEGYHACDILYFKTYITQMLNSMLLLFLYNTFYTSPTPLLILCTFIKNESLWSFKIHPIDVVGYTKIKFWYQISW